MGLAGRRSTVLKTCALTPGTGKKRIRMGMGENRIGFGDW